jgi:putative endonuclease
MWYVYVLKSDVDGSYYKGCTNDLDRRFGEHNAGYEKYTAAHRPWALVWSCVKPSLSEARLLERKLKNISSHKRLAAFLKKYGGPDAPVGGLDADKPA